MTTKTISYSWNVVIWNGTREVGIDADGTQHADLSESEVFDEKTAHEVAKKFNGKAIDAFADEGWDDED
jgi:hypothetical protein